MQEKTSETLKFDEKFILLNRLFSNISKEQKKPLKNYYF
jgi:hypothetical protein